MNLIKSLAAALVALAASAGAQSQFTPVQPQTKGKVPAGELKIGQGRFFSFAMPPGWRIGEDGQFALTQVSPNNMR